MHLDINKSLFIFIGWLIRVSHHLECLQCTSSIRRVSQSWDHSCLDGTLTSSPCQESINESGSPYKLCVSSIYRIGQRGSAGVLIQRGCTTNDIVQHDCDPPGLLIDFDKSSNFYCSRTCLGDGCNRHSAEEVSSNGIKLFQYKLILIYIICFIYSIIF